MTLVGVVLHARDQSIAALDAATGEPKDLRWRHDGDAAERLYADLPAPAIVPIESTAYTLWVHALLQRLGHTLVVGDAAKIRARAVRRTTTAAAPAA